MSRRRKSKVEREANAPGNLPSVGFMEWWNPTSTQEPSGASVGGHPDAERVWARKDPGKWTRRTFGVNANHAWLAHIYRDEYLQWVEAGKPERNEEFISICAEPLQQIQFARELLAILKQLCKPPKATDEAARRRVIQQQKVALLGDSKPVQGRVIEDDDEPIPF